MSIDFRFSIQINESFKLSDLIFFHTKNIFNRLVSEHEDSIKIDSRDDIGVDVDNDDDIQMGDMDSGDHDSNDMSRPRKIRR